MRKSIVASLFAFVLSCVPRVVWAHEFGEPCEATDPIIGSIIIASTVAVTSFFAMMYWRHYRKFFDEKWGMMQYLILIPILILITFVSLIFFLVVGDYLFRIFALEWLFIPLLCLAMLSGLFLGFSPLMWRRKWIYVWGVPIGLLLSLTVIVWVLISWVTFNPCDAPHF